MMTTALLMFLGLSACATLAIVSAVVMGARRSIPLEDASEFEPSMITSQSEAAGSSFSPAYNH